MNQSSRNKAEIIKSISKMNEDLRMWVNEIEKGEGLEKTIEQRQKEEISGKCEICGVNDAKFVCIKCGRKVCSSCYFSILGLCKKCVSKDVVEKWKGEKKDWEKILGVKWID